MSETPAAQQPMCPCACHEDGEPYCEECFESGGHHSPADWMEAAWKEFEQGYSDHDEFIAALARHAPPTEGQPRIVCLCGSTRFRGAFEAANFAETMAGRIILSVGCFMHADAVPITAEQKVALDQLHKRKIDLADEVLVLDVDGYIGSSTRSEIDYAITHGKPVRYLSQEAAAPKVKP